MLDHQVLQYFPSGLIIVKISAESGRILNKNTGETNICEPNIFSTNGSLDYFHRSSSNEMRAYKIEQEYLSSDQDPEPHSVSCKFPKNLVIEAMKNSVIYIPGQVF